ncbi:PPR repeat [Musa troglodytarum]|uniref:PPR repeat n=1 Tax=Musa troglodytarum TaxID=320322 RepID=A0A9E7JLI6_9LILI|nr:PPR repeat [Musa troglodytarum]
MTQRRSWWTGTMPDDESYNLVVGLLILMNEIDSAFKNMDLTIKSGYIISTNVFMDCVRSCVNAGWLDTLASITEKCKTTDQNKALCPSWSLYNYIADVALQADHSKLVYFSLEFLARWISRGENARPPVLLSAEEGLVVSAVGTTDAAWSILQRSLHQKRAPSPETYLAKIYAHASLGQLECAFATLNEFETVYENSEVDQELFSPFTSVYPLVVACCKNGFSTLDLTTEACKVYEHLVRLGVKPNAATYSLLVDAHLLIRDSKAALSVEAGFTPKETLKKVQRCCSQELDFAQRLKLLAGQVSWLVELKSSMGPVGAGGSQWATFFLLYWSSIGRAQFRLQLRVHKPKEKREKNVQSPVFLECTLTHSTTSGLPDARFTVAMTRISCGNPGTFQRGDVDGDRAMQRSVT